MYAFQANRSSHKKHRRIVLLLTLLIVILGAALAGVTYSYIQQKTVVSAIPDALTSRAISEANDAQTAVYRLTQSSGTNTASQLSVVRSHVYALQALNELTQSIYGADNYLTPQELIETALSTLDTCEAKLSGGRVLTTQFTELRDQIDAIAAVFGIKQP